MTHPLDDEIFPYTPADVGVPFVLQPGSRTDSLFESPFYPTQGEPPKLDMAGELRGLYGAPGALTWKPEWSAYRGKRPRPEPHWGVDIYGPAGEPVVAVVDGELSFLQDLPGLGLYALLRFTRQGKQYVFHYGHLKAASGAARSVTKGERVGFIGCSGNANNTGICSVNAPGQAISSSHLHLALVAPPDPNRPKRADPLGVLGWKLHSPAKPGWL
jgi:murein DD-endopeptidase MepM/ murein hydrolase activator NlpD